MENKNKVIIISPSYNNFVKDQVDLIATFVQKIDIFVRYNPLVELSNYTKLFKRGTPFNKENIVNTNNKPDNVNLFLIKLFFLPMEIFQYKMGLNYFTKISKQLTNQSKYSLIHCHFLWPQGDAGLKLKAKLKIPLIITAHRYDILLAFKSDIWKKKITFVLNQADKIICVSPYYQELLKKLVPNKEIEIIPNGYNGKLFYKRDQIECRKKLHLPTNKKILLNVGYLTKRKGQSELIRAMKIVCKNRNDILCIIIGDGEYRNNLESEVSKNHLNDVIKLVGAKKHEEVPIWMNACDIFVLPSYDESFGVVNVEALACGKPVISTFNHGSEYIITTESIGNLVESGNVTQLAEKIEISLKKDWNESTIITYAKQYDWGNVVQKIMTLYSSSLQKRDNE